MHFYGVVYQGSGNGTGGELPTVVEAPTDFVDTRYMFREERDYIDENPVYALTGKLATK